MRRSTASPALHRTYDPADCVCSPSPTNARAGVQCANIAETLPGYDSRGWFGFLAPAGTPREIITLLNQEINRANALPDVKEKLVSAGLIVVTEPPEFCVND